MAVLSWRGLDTIVRTRVTLTSTLEQTRGMQLAFAQMQSDCEHIVKSEEIGARATLLAEPDRLTLVRTTYADNQPSRLQVVAYRLRAGVLSRTESEAVRDLRLLDELWRAATADGQGGAAVTLQSGVEAMNLRLWNRNTGWRSVAAPSVAVPGIPATEQGQTQAPPSVAPTGLEVTLRLGASQSGMVKVMLLGAV